jgi:urea transport system substrate-binding protein
MADDPRLAVLIERWEEARRAGGRAEPEELCRDCPELADALRRRVAAVTLYPRDTTTTAPAVLLPETIQAASPGGPAQLGGFRLVRVLGEGGMGIVYEGEDLTLNRRVALKMVRPELVDDALRRRFLREARSAAALRHDRIVTIYQVGQEGDTPFLVMEFLEGESLEARLRRQSWLPLPEALDIARQIAEGLAAAHAKGMIHRDIKPANIWLESPHARIKLLDFGLARALQNNSELTAHGMIVGTPGYMAPEQIYAGPLDARTDLYSLGCVLFRLLSGQLPYDGPNTRELLETVVSQDAPDLEQSAVHIPAPVALLLRQLLARDPKDRPASAEIVVARLRDLERSHVALPPLTSAAAASGAAAPPRVGLKAGVWAGALTIVLAAVAGLFGLYYRMTNSDAEVPAAAAIAPLGTPIRLGVLHSLSGTFSGSERPMVDAIVMAAEEINRAGGVLGRKVELVLADGHSDEREFGILAEKLIVEDKVSAIVGCWSSSARRRTAAACEKHANLLIHASLNEGLEESPNTIYVGGAPNQQLQPAAKWAYAELHKSRFFLIGSDYLFSHACNQILRDILDKLKADVVGEEYVPLEGTEFGPLVKKVRDTKADIIFSTVDGSSNIALFQALRAQGIRPADVPTVWLSLGDADMASLRLKDMVGDYSASPYFQTCDLPANVEFVKRFTTERYPGRTRIGDSTEASYCAVHMWKKAVERAGSAAPLKVREAFRGLTYDEAPEGPIRIDEKNLHAWRMARFARLDEQLKFEILFATARPVAPEPFPASRSRGAWQEYLRLLSKSWDGQWEAPRQPGR